jgi:hypothetical protein
MVGCRCKQKLYKSCDLFSIILYKRILCGARTFLAFLVGSINENLTTLWASVQEKSSRVWWPEGTEVGQWAVRSFGRRHVAGNLFATTRGDATPFHDMCRNGQSRFALLAGQTICTGQARVPQVRCRFHLSGIRAVISMRVDYGKREGEHSKAHKSQVP